MNRERYDLMIRGGTIYDGSGSQPYVSDIGVDGDVIVSIGDLADTEAAAVIDATGLAVAPGFINVLSHAYFTVLHDPRSLSDLKQGVTTQLFGEAFSMGPLNDEMLTLIDKFRGPLEFDVAWTRLSEYLAHVERRGVSQNVASLIGATTLRLNALGSENRPPTKAEMDKMKGLVEEEMADGAFGIGSALIYAPGSYAPTEELIGICQAASKFGGKYFSHLRSEGEGFIEGIEELLRISREAEVPAEIWHLKVAGPDNWTKVDRAIELIEGARAAGEPISADMYPYTAGATMVAAAIPPWFHEGGFEALSERLRDPSTRSEIKDAIENSTEGWENLYRLSGGADGVLILRVDHPELRQYQGRRLSEVAEQEGTDPVEALIDLVIRSDSKAFAAYFIISEENIRKQIAFPWISFGSDAGSMAPEGVFLDEPTHPRAYGTFARVLGKYVREEGLISLPDAIRRLSRLPAEVLGIDRRGRLEKDHFADIVVFDPATVSDKATFEDPHQFAVGVRDVVVNGQLTLRDGEFAGTFAGRAVYGPGRRS
jgi:N-acyl-D-amino-acid deacylase